MAFSLQLFFLMALRSLSLVLATLLVLGPGKPVRAAPPGLGSRLSSLLRAKEQRSRALAAEKPGLRGKAHLLAARLLHAGRHITVGARRLQRRAPSGDQVWLGSSVGLAASEVGCEGLASAARTVGQSRLMRGLKVLGLGAGVGLAALGARNLSRARNTLERLDAGGDLAWGTEGALYFAGGRALGSVAQGVGIVGAGLQTAAGIRRIIKGAREHDRSLVKLGALDLAGGLTWMAWDTVGLSNPYLLAGYAGLMVAREAYANREAVKAFGKRTAAKVTCALGRCRAKIARSTEWVREQSGAALRTLAAGLRGPPARPPGLPSRAQAEPAPP